MRGERALSIGVTLAAAGAMSLSPENSHAQNAPGIDPFEHPSAQGAANCIDHAFLPSPNSSEPIAAAMVDSKGDSIHESQICDAPYTNAVTVEDAIRSGLLNPSEVPNGMGNSDIYITWSDRPGTVPQKREIPARDTDNTSGSGGDGDGKPNGREFGKQIRQGAEFQAEIPPTPTPAAVVENIGSPDLNLVATMNELAPGAYDEQIQYALGMLNIPNPQTVVEVNMNGHNFRNRVVFVDGTYYAFDKTLENPFVAQVGGTYFDIEEAFGIEHWVTIKGDPNIRPEPGTAQDNIPVGQAVNGTRLRVVGEPKDDPDPSQSRDWIPIVWDPDGDGNGEQAHVASDFTDGVEKVVRADAVVREITPEQALIESIGQFPGTPDMVTSDNRYSLYYSDRYVDEELGGIRYHTGTSNVDTAFSIMLRDSFAHASDNSNLSQEPVQWGDVVAITPRSPNRSLLPGDSPRVEGALQGIVQYGVSAGEFRTYLSMFRNNPEEFSNRMAQIGMVPFQIPNDRPDHTIMTLPYGSNPVTSAIVFFAEDASGRSTLYAITPPYSMYIARETSPANYVADGLSILAGGLTESLIDSDDEGNNDLRFNGGRNTSDVVSLFKSFGCTAPSWCATGSPAIREN